MFTREGTVCDSNQSERLYSHAELLKILDSVLNSIRSDVFRYLDSPPNKPLAIAANQESSGVGSERRPHQRHLALTARQFEVLRYLAQGLTVKEIAYCIHRSPKTIAAHKAQIMERLGLRDLAGLIIYAIRQGIIDIANQ